MSCYIIELADCALTPYAIETESGTEYGWGLMPKRKVDLNELLRVADECDAADVDGVIDWAARIRKAVAELERRGYEVVDTYFKDGFAVPPKVVNVPLYYLSQSLGKMAECDAVYLCDGWENARGCKVERAAAVAYDLELIGYDLPCRGDAS